MTLEDGAELLVPYLLSQRFKLSLCETATEGLLRSSLQEVEAGPAVIHKLLGPPYGVEDMFTMLGLPSSLLQRHPIVSLEVMRAAWKVVEPSIGKGVVCLLVWGRPDTGDVFTCFKRPDQEYSTSMEWERSKFDTVYPARSIAQQLMMLLVSHFKPEEKEPPP